MSDTAPVNGDLDVDIVEDDLTSVEWDIEVPEADAVEQRATVSTEAVSRVASIPPEADPADAADQQREVELDDDEYR